MEVYNGGDAPRIVAWGEGLVLPGQSIEWPEDSPVVSPWTTDAQEAAQAAERYAEAHQSTVTPEPVSEPQDAPQGPLLGPAAVLLSTPPDVAAEPSNPNPVEAS